MIIIVKILNFYISGFNTVNCSLGSFACLPDANFFIIIYYGYRLANIPSVYNIALQIILLLLSWGLTRYFTHTPFPVRAYIITLCVVSVGFAGAYYFGTVSFANTLAKIGLVAMLLLVLLATKLVTKSEVKELLAVVIPTSSSTGEQKRR